MKHRRPFCSSRRAVDSPDISTLPSWIASIKLSVKKLLHDVFSIKLGVLSSRIKIDWGRIGKILWMLEPAQIRAGRALLGWRQEDLSKASGVGTATIQRLEKSDAPMGGYVSTLVRIQAAFEKAGILLINEDEIAGIGVRLTKKRRR
jgi:Helix-turn-helix